MIADEPVEVIDLDGRVLEIVTRAEMRRRNLRHRATYIVVRSGGGDVLAHRRAPWKDIWPDRWDVSFGGVCAVGEEWNAAARRELCEEAGITATLAERGPIVFDNETTHVVGRLYETTHDGPFTFPDGEVVAVEWVPFADLPAWVERHELCDDARGAVLPRLLEGARP